MVAYHLAWDLDHFGVITADVVGDPAWRLFAKAIAASFLFIAGVSLAFATRQGVRWPSFLRRLGVLSAAALAVTVATWITFPDRFIFFGILHAIAVSSLLALALHRLPAGGIALAGLAVLVLPHIVQSDAFNAPALIWLGLGTAVPLTNDFEPVFPWAGWMLLGLAAGRLNRRAQRVPSQQARGSLLARLGRWSLVIYLVHQPVLFTLVGQMAQRGWLPLAGQEAQIMLSCTGECGVGGASDAICRATCDCALGVMKAGDRWRRLAGREVRSALSSAVQSCLRGNENLSAPAPKS